MTPRWWLYNFLQLSGDLPSDFVTLLSERVTKTNLSHETVFSLFFMKINIAKRHFLCVPTIDTHGLWSISQAPCQCEWMYCMHFCSCAHNNISFPLVIAVCPSSENIFFCPLSTGQNSTHTPTHRKNKEENRLDFLRHKDKRESSCDKRGPHHFWSESATPAITPTRHSHGQKMNCLEMDTSK